MADKQEAARRLAKAHFLVEDGLVNVFRLVSPTESDPEPIKLLEVNRDTVATGIMPVRFDAVPERGIPSPLGHRGGDAGGVRADSDRCFEFAEQMADCRRNSQRPDGVGPAIEV
jgi:hypothetical protein